MKVLQIGKYFYPERGGIETYLYQLCKGLKPKVDVLDILVSNTKFGTVIDKYDGLDLIRSGKWDQFFSTPFCPSFFKYIKRNYYDIIHIHLPNPMAILACLFLKPGGKYVVSYHSDIIKQKFLFSMYKRFIVKFLDQVHTIIVATPNHIEFSPILMNYKEKCKVVHYGISLPGSANIEFEDVEDIKKIREEIGKGLPIVLFVGRLVYYKGREYLIQAVEGLPVQLVIAGNGPYYSTMKIFKDQIPNIHFTGEITEQRLRQFYLASDIFCLPSVSRAEAFGLVQLEAMSYGKPVISTDLQSGVPYVNKHEHTGLIVKKECSSAISDAIMFLINNKDKAKEFGENGFKRVTEEFSLKKMIEETFDVYSEIMKT